MEQIDTEKNRKYIKNCKGAHSPKTSKTTSKWKCTEL